jgi:hypothetical protein
MQTPPAHGLMAPRRLIRFFTCMPWISCHTCFLRIFVRICLDRGTDTTELLYAEASSTTATGLVNSNKGARVYIRNYDICRILALYYNLSLLGSRCCPVALCSNGCMHGACAGDIDFWCVFCLSVVI